MTGEQIIQGLAGRFPDEVIIRDDKHQGRRHEWQGVAGTLRFVRWPWWGIKGTLWRRRYRCCGKCMLRVKRQGERECQLCHIRRREGGNASLSALCSECGAREDLDA